MIIDDLPITVTRKNIKNIHLRIYPPNGDVRVSAPARMSLDIIKQFILSKLGWIKKQQLKFRSQTRVNPLDFLPGELHYFGGRPYLFNVVEENRPGKVEITDKTITLHVRPGTTRDKKEHLLNEWYRMKLKKVIPPMIAKYEKIMRVTVAEFGIKKMKTRWGTCNITARRIWLNLELAKNPPELLEYVVVHEMVHLLERRHNRRFKTFMDRFMPKWRFYKDELNRFTL